MRYAVLLYHGINDGVPSARSMNELDREYVLDWPRFQSHVAYLATKPVGSIRTVISFDDGNLSAYIVAAPLLEQHGLRGEFFVVTRWIGRRGFMTVEHLRDLVARGHGVHSHSRTHPCLPTLSTEHIEDELRGSKDDLEAALGSPVAQFSIPGGAYDDRVLEMAKRAGYTAVMNSVEGYNDDSAPDFLVRRFTLRPYSEVSMLAGICEQAGRTCARLVLKRAAISLARGVIGDERYGRLRDAIISRRGGARAIRGQQADGGRRGGDILRGP